MPDTRPAAWQDPTLTMLTGSDAGELLSAALVQAGAELAGWRVRDVDVRPGRRTTASYSATVSWPDGIRPETLCASAQPAASQPARVAPDDGRLVVTDGEHEVSVWRFPFDPELPALPAACYPGSAAELLRRLGIDCTRPPHLDVVSYRPRKRAVVAARRGELTVFIKVVRPSAVDGIRRRHEILAGAGLPVPGCLGWSDDGLMVLAELPGVSLGSAADAAGGRACHAGELIRILDRLPADVRRLPRRRPWSAHVSHYADVVATALPAEAERARTLAVEIVRQLSDDGTGDEPTHGDFYEAQLTVRNGRIAGMLDVDTIGPGQRVDDLACLLAHMDARATVDPDASGNLRDAVERWLPVFDARVEPRELRVRTAAVGMSLATGPFRAQEPGWERGTAARLDLVQEWLERAQRDTRG